MDAAVGRESGARNGLASGVTAISLVALGWNLGWYRDESLWLCLPMALASLGLWAMRARRRLRAAIVLAAVWAAIGINELVLAWVVRHYDNGRLEVPSNLRVSSNPVLSYVPLPGTRVGDCVNQPGGYCGPEVILPKSDGVFRIVVVGDSTGFASGDPGAIPYHSAMAEELCLRGVEVEVVNGSVIGYNTLQEEIWLRTRLLSLQPDLVILGYCVNDRFPQLLFLTATQFRWVRLARMALCPEPFDPTQGDFERFSAAPMRRMRALLDERGIPIVAVIIPYLGELQGGSTPIATVYDQIEGLLLELGIPFVDSERGWSPEQLRAFMVDEVDHIHPRGAFHRQFGAELAHFLERRGLLPGAR